ncbi:MULTISPECIES: TonB-dependent receptor domain-containing protein [Sphingobium]|uniref:TonB-dependent receptor domain-containing protein n=1 Tax=Sphingobium sp. MI1205 TaxID=407020 RepID=UPI000B028DA0|nr:TonB-dependent receptor [Sphingobium sp. MI1205]
MAMSYRRCALQVSLFLATALVTPAMVQAQSPQKQFNIAAQPLGDALRQFGLQAGRPILFSERFVQGRQAPALRGRFPIDGALERLIGGSGLHATSTSDGVIMLNTAAPAPQLLHKLAALSTPHPIDAPAALAPAPAEAAAQPAGLSDIIVTAQKRAENVQDTPISIDVVNSEQLTQRGIQGIQDLMSGAVPSIKMATQSGRGNALMVTMRGITGGDPSQISRDSAVGIYIDGVYLGRVQGLGTELFDLERIEVLRGPQGTLFGRNAVGGALNIISKRPTGRLGFEVTGGLSNFDGQRLKGTLNLPALAGVSVKLDGLFSRRDGWVDNEYSDAWDWGQYRKWGFRAQALWEPSSDFEALYSFDISKDSSSPAYTHIAEALPGVALPPIFSLEPDRVNTGRIGVPLDPSVAKVHGHSLTLNWDIADGMTVRSITAYRKLDQTQDDNDGGYLIGYRPNGNFARRSLATVKQDQFSQELQVIGTTDHLKYVVGAFHFEEDAHDSAYAPFLYRWNANGTAYTVNNPPVGGLPPDRASSNHVKSDALFAQATWTPSILDDRLHLTGGLRYTHDRKHGTLDLLRGVPSTLAYRFSSKRTDPMVTVAYDISRDVNAYVKYGVAYRAGGGGSRSPTFRPFAEEEVGSWELGLKSEFWDRRARLNIALYHSDYKDMQVVFPYPSNPSTSEIANVPGKVKIEGAEVDLTVTPARGLTLTTSYNFITTEVPQIVSPLSGLPQAFYMAFTPKHSGTAAVDYSVPIDERTITLHADANYSTSFHSFAESPRSPGYFLVNGRVTLSDIDVGAAGKMSVALWGRNLFNEQFETWKFRAAGAGLSNTDTVNFNEPRTYGVEATFKF